ncbi:hypothetical protein VbVaMValp1_19 [Vibrio phage Vb_VaM_Valp1]
MHVMAMFKLKLIVGSVMFYSLCAALLYIQQA